MSYLNAKPLIHGLLDENPGRLTLTLDVPARLLATLEAGEVDLALCPVIDYFRSAAPLRLVPVGGIACRGPTLTVRLYSRVPLDQITTVHADTDSHTSVALLRLLLRGRYGLTPTLVDFDAHADPAARPRTLLLIGDKVVTAAPPADDYPVQLDLGGAWHDWTGRPFVFATWMARRETGLGDLPERLTQQLDRNLGRLPQIVDTYAAEHGWPAELAARYLSQILRYRLGPQELAAIDEFGRRVTQLMPANPVAAP